MRPGLKPAAVLDVIKSELGDDVCLVVERDIVNIQQSERVKELDGSTELEAEWRELSADNARF